LVKTVYVPVDPSVTGSTKPAKTPIALETSVESSGLRIETVPFGPPLTFMLMRCPLVPANVWDERAGNVRRDTVESECHRTGAGRHRIDENRVRARDGQVSRLN
jgi:hypothetical protein